MADEERLAEVLQQLVGRALPIPWYSTTWPSASKPIGPAAQYRSIRARSGGGASRMRAQSICRRHLRQRSRYANDASAQSTRYA